MSGNTAKEVLRELELLEEKFPPAEALEELKRRARERVRRSEYSTGFSCSY